MKLVDNDSAFSSFKHFLWCISAVNAILCSEDALRAWVFPVVQSVVSHFKRTIDFSTFLNLVSNIGEIPVVINDESDCNALCMIAVPVEDPSNPVSIGVSAAYLRRVSPLGKCAPAKLNAKFHALVLLLHGCMHLMAPHIAKYLAEIGDLNSEGDEMPCDLGVMWEEYILGGIMSAPGRTFSSVRVVRQDDNPNYANQNRWTIPPATCARVVRQIDRWMHPTVLGRACKYFRRPCPSPTCDAERHLSGWKHRDAARPHPKRARMLTKSSRSTSFRAGSRKPSERALPKPPPALRTAALRR